MHGDHTLCTRTLTRSRLLSCCYITSEPTGIGAFRLAFKLQEGEFGGNTNWLALTKDMAPEEYTLANELSWRLNPVTAIELRHQLLRFTQLTSSRFIEHADDFIHESLKCIELDYSPLVVAISSILHAHDAMHQSCADFCHAMAEIRLFPENRQDTDSCRRCVYQRKQDRGSPISTIADFGSVM